MEVGNIFNMVVFIRSLGFPVMLRALSNICDFFRGVGSA